MLKSQSDKELLDAFVKSHDEQAFHCLAERYSGLIYHTALRTLDDRILAEDVAQRVLGVLARKAAQVSRGNAPLPAWLHRTAILEAKSARRIESRHQRKKEALMREPNDAADSNEAAWKDVLPHLDAAIDTLPEADRHVLLLHFVNELTFPEIAKRVGKTAAAVQKQSRRALEKLQGILNCRGVTLSLVILTAGLTTEMTKAAPVILIPALGSISTLGKTTSAIVVKKSTLAALAATVLVCGIPLAWQQVRIHQLDASLTHMTLETNNPTMSRSHSRNPGVSLIRRLAGDLKARNTDVPRYISAVDYIDSLTDEELIQLSLETTASSLAFNDQEFLFGQLFGTLSNRNVELTLNSLLDRIPATYVGKSYRAHDMLVEGMKNLAENDAASALAWFNSHLAAIRELPNRENMPDGLLKSEMRFSLSCGFMFTDPGQAIEILRSVPEHIITAGIQQLAQNKCRILQEHPEGPIRVVRELLRESASCQAITCMTGTYIECDRNGLPIFKAIEDFLDHQDLSTPEIEAILKLAGTDDICPPFNPGCTIEKRMLHYRNWLEKTGCENADWRVGAAVAILVNSWNGDKAPVYAAMLNRKSMGLSDDAAVGFLRSLDTRGRIKSTDVGQIEKIAATVDDQGTVREVVERIKKHFDE